MIGIAMIGAGRMAGVHAKAIVSTRARIVSVFDVVAESAARLAEAVVQVALRGVPGAHVLGLLLQPDHLSAVGVASHFRSQ